MAKTNSKPMSDAELKKAVLAAIEKLRKDGLEPTTRNVYAITKGRHSRVLDFLREIKTEEEAKRKRLEEVPDLPEDVQDVFLAVWATAWKAADTSAAEARQMYSEKVSELEQECEARRDFLADLEEQLEAERNARKSLEAKLQAALAEASDLQKQLVSAEQRLGGRKEILDLLGEVLPAKGNASVPKRRSRSSQQDKDPTGKLPFDVEADAADDMTMKKP